MEHPNPSGRPISGGAARTEVYPTQVAPDQPVARIGEFEILGELGRGGMGVVYRARDERLGRIVALKVLPSGLLSSLPAIERFHREARAAAALDHPGIVRTHAFGEAQGNLYIVQELVEGRPLDRWIRDRDAGISPREAAELVLALSRAVAHAHTRGVVHRDLKPSNVLVSTEGTPKLVDFGLAHLEGETRLSRTGDVMGTPVYMAPEQVQGDPRRIGPATDVHGLGAVLYELLTGSPPFGGDTVVQIYRRIVQEDPIPPSTRNPRVGREIEAICLKCLEKDPACRYRSAGDLAGDLQAFLSGEPVVARPPGLGTRLVRRARRRRLELAVAAVLAPGLAGTAWFSVGPARLLVRTEPAGATIYLDGEAVGTGPLDRRVWPPGPHDLAARLAGHDAAEASLELSAAGTHEKTLVLERRTGLLRVASDPTGAEILVDGEPTARLTPAELVVGEGVHLVSLRLADHEEHVARVDVPCRQTAGIERVLPTCESRDRSSISAPQWRAGYWIVGWGSTLPGSTGSSDA